MTVTGTEIDPQTLEAAAGKVLSIYAGSMLNYMIDIGHRTGLLATACQGPGTSEELAARAGLTERYVREWLAAMVTGGVFDYDPATTTYTLPAAAAAVLTGGPLPLAVMAGLQTHLAKHVGAVARAFREGGGVPYSAYRPELTDLMDQIGRTWYDTALLDAYLPLVGGLAAQLEAGASAADIACGTGHALVVLARRFPASTFAGFDLDEGAIARARGRGLRCRPHKRTVRGHRRRPARPHRRLRSGVRVRRHPRPGRSRRRSRLHQHRPQTRWRVHDEGAPRR